MSAHNRLNRKDPWETIFPLTLTAYRKNHSCCTTLLRLTEDWKIEADSNNIIGATLIDLSKAFDRIPHNLLLEKLSAYGVSLESLELLTNYVKNRTHCVRLGNTRSTTGKLMSGVPQGSVLGPHLFNIFINDLFYNIKKAKISAYADDKQLYFSNANARIVQKTLNSELAVVSSWITHNGLLLNPKKCESLIFRRINSKSNQTEEDKINFSVDGTLIEPSTTCKLLGVHIDERLNFNNHVASICKKISKQIAVVSRFRKLLSIQTKLTLYKAYILPHFTYCSTVWMHCGKTASDKLLKLITYSCSSYPTRASYSGQVDEFRNPMKTELKTRPCLKAVFQIIWNTDANFLNLHIDKATKTRGDKQLYLITHFTKQTLNLYYLLLTLNVTEQFLKNLKQKRPFFF